MFVKELSAISRYWYRDTHRSLMTGDIAGSEHSIIMTLAVKECMNQEELSEYLSLDKGTIAKLEEKGFVNRKVNEDNRREKIVTLTEYGKEEVGKISAVSEPWSDEVLKGVSGEDPELFFRTLLLVSLKARMLVDEDINEN